MSDTKLSDRIWVIVHRQTDELWGLDGWMIPPGDVMIYDDYAEVVEANGKIGGVIMEFRKDKKVS